MQCPICGGPTRACEDQRVALPVDVPGVSLDGVTVHTCTSCGEVFEELPPLESLLDAVAQLFIQAPRDLRGPEIRFLRKRLGWSRDDFAAQFCVDPTTVSKWESGAFAMDAFKQKMLRKFARGGPLLESYEHDVPGTNAPPPFRLYVPDFAPPTPPTRAGAAKAKRRATRS